MTPGETLKALRERLGLTLKDVETTSNQLSKRYENEELALPASRLSEIETKGMLPSIYRLYTLSVVYKTGIPELLKIFGIHSERYLDDNAGSIYQKTHLFSANEVVVPPRMPTTLDPGFDPKRTLNIGRFIQKWGTFPLNFLKQFEAANFRYGYVGMEDFTMYPLILPGTFLQIDKRENQIPETAGWASDYERPIFFFETREEYICSWCSRNNNQILIQPHSMSPVKPQAFKFPDEIGVLGRVVGIAMRLGDRTNREIEREQKEHPRRIGNEQKKVL